MDERHVIITRFKGNNDGPKFHSFHETADSAFARKKKADELHGNEWERTVHKVGPALSPPEPREYLVIEATGATGNEFLTRETANLIAHTLPGRRVVRVVEDGKE